MYFIIWRWRSGAAINDVSWRLVGGFDTLSDAIDWRKLALGDDLVDQIEMIISQKIEA